ncbi:MAG: hypothetical protein ACI8PG_001425, partial [Planctomycetota bacterium]
MQRNRNMNKTVSLVAFALTAFFSVGVGHAQLVEWQLYAADAEVPANAVRVRIDKGLLLCRGTHADTPDGKNAWRDVGTMNNGVCRTQRTNEDLKKQEEFYLLVASPETVVKWIMHDASSKIPEGAVRVRIDKGLLLCRGTHADTPDGKNAWRDVGTMNNEVCRTQRTNEDLKKQEEFYLLLAELKGDAAGLEPVDLFGDIISETEALSGVIEEWVAVWDETAQGTSEAYGTNEDTPEFADELGPFEGEIPFEEDREYPVDLETLNAIYRAGMDVTLRFGSIANQVVSMATFLSANLADGEHADLNEQLIVQLMGLGEQLGQAGSSWGQIMQKTDHKIEGVTPGLGRDAVVNSLSDARMAAVQSMGEQGLNISRSDLETGSWNLSKQQTSTGRVQKGSKKKRSNRVEQ